MKTTVIDYKAGNLTSVVKALRHLGADVEVTDTPGPLANATHIILPRCRPLRRHQTPR